MASVLVLDDEKSLRVLLGKTLRDAGYEVIEVADAEAAHGWVDRRPLDVALLDIHLQEGNGMDVARHIRDQQPDVRSILITADPDFSSASEAIRLHIFDYLVKPIGREQLLNVVGYAAAAKARDREYDLMLLERNRHQENLERHVKLRTAELNQTAAELHALAARLQVVREEERMALARELHDEFGQNLTALQIDLDWLDRHLQVADAVDVVQLRARIATMAPLAERLTVMTQAVCASLRPGMLDDLGLLAAIEWQVEDCQKRTGLTCVVSLPAHEVVLDPNHALALFRILQESLTNVVRHAQATRVDVRLVAAERELHLEVRDNGRGFRPESFPGAKALGLLSMRERAIGFEGTVVIESELGKGTLVRVRVPLVGATAAGVPRL